MLNPSRCVVLILAAAIGTAAAFNGAEPRAPEEGHPPLVSWSGSYSAITTARVLLVSDDQAWERLWKEHAGDKIETTGHGLPVWPRVDFQRCMVLAIFSGSETNGCGVHVLSAAEGDGVVRVRIDWCGFQTSAPPGQKDLGVATSGYGMAVLLRAALPMVVEENVQGLKDQPALWKERARLPAPAVLAP